MDIDDGRMGPQRSWGLRGCLTCQWIVTILGHVCVTRVVILTHALMSIGDMPKIVCQAPSLQIWIH
jgi:hypothetical protein